jgi:hypothetical protein
VKRAVALILLGIVSTGCGASKPSGPSPGVTDYSGNWSGTYTLQSCSSFGPDAVGVCDNFPVNGQGGFGLNLSQSGSAVTGLATVGPSVVPSTSGSVANDGSLALNGSTAVGGGIVDTARWMLTLPSGALAGTFSLTRTTGSSGFTITGMIVSATKS